MCTRGQAAAATAVATLQAAELQEGEQQEAEQEEGRKARLAATRAAASTGLLEAVAAAGPFGMVLNEPLLMMAFGAAVK